METGRRTSDAPPRRDRARVRDTLGRVILCPTCKAELADGAQFCPKDGTTLSPPAPPADPLIGRVLDGRYRVRARLGAGGVGAVYEGEHVEIKKVVALKVLHA